MGLVMAEMGYGIGVVDIGGLLEVVGVGFDGFFLRRSSQAANIMIPITTAPPAEAPAMIGILFLLEGGSLVGVIDVEDVELEDDEAVTTHSLLVLQV